MRDGSQFTCMLFHPRIDGGIPLEGAVESQQFRSHRRSAFCFRDLWLHSTLTRGTKRQVLSNADSTAYPVAAVWATITVAMPTYGSNVPQRRIRDFQAGATRQALFSQAEPAGDKAAFRSR